MRRTALVLVISGLCGALVACGDEPEQTGQRDVSVGGKILDRSITDDMLPYDTVTSQAPRAKSENNGSGSSAGQAGETGRTNAPAVTPDAE